MSTTDGSAAATQTIVNVPGDLTAVYENGRIVSWTFVPSAAWGGDDPAARVDDGDETLDVQDTDGAFWRAVQAALLATDGAFTVGWSE